MVSCAAASESIFRHSMGELAYSRTLALPGEPSAQLNAIIEQQRHPADRPMSLGGRRTRCDVPSAQAILDLGILFSTKCNGSDLPFNGPGPSLSCGCSSVVEHDLAKVGVEGSN